MQAQKFNVRNTHTGPMTKKQQLTQRGLTRQVNKGLIWCHGN